ncbi:hypothetical protein HAX54_042849, partial [Datura stramonium]|nr:hypothetical protein [Datura stramonium]
MVWIILTNRVMSFREVFRRFWKTTDYGMTHGMIAQNHGSPHRKLQRMVLKVASNHECYYGWYDPGTTRRMGHTPPTRIVSQGHFDKILSSYLLNYSIRYFGTGLRRGKNSIEWKTQRIIGPTNDPWEGWPATTSSDYGNPLAVSYNESLWESQRTFPKPKE